MSEVLMPYEDPTRETQIVGRVLNVLSYLLALLVAVGAFAAPPASLQELTPPEWLVLTSGTLAVLSVVGLVAVSTRRWRVEWVASTSLAFLLLECSVPGWMRLFTGFPESTSLAALTALGAVSLAQRALSLWIFAIRTWQTAERAHDVG